MTSNAYVHALPSCDRMVAIRAGCQGTFPGTFNIHNARQAVKKARKQRKLLARLTEADEGDRAALAVRGQQQGPLKLLLRQGTNGIWAVAPVPVKFCV